MLKLHNKIIKEVINEKKKDPKVISLLLYGSLARGTAHKESDVDIEVVYDCERYKDVSERRYGVKVDFEIWPKKKLIKRIENYPFLSYPYLEEKILYDPTGFAESIKKRLKTYFSRHPDALKAWKDWTKKYLMFKKKKNKMKDADKIREAKRFYDELEIRFSEKHKVTRNF